MNIRRRTLEAHCAIPSTGPFSLDYTDSPIHQIPDTSPVPVLIRPLLSSIKPALVRTRDQKETDAQRLQSFSQITSNSRAPSH